MLDFDISQDELPIFVAEADEQLQTLDELLVILEKGDEDPEQLQTAFRAAHTLKGMAGMINHHRMVEVTHALETIFDGLRKNSLIISTEMIDLCLDAVDILRLLRSEVDSGSEGNVDLDDILYRFKDFVDNGRTEVLSANLKSNHDGLARSVISQPVAPPPLPVTPVSMNGGSLLIQAEISPKSIASAARAFQVVMALQELGEILMLEPSMDVIESAIPIHHLTAAIKTNTPETDIRKKILNISEIDGLLLGVEVKDHKVAPDLAQSTEAVPSPAPAENSNHSHGPKQLGDYLVSQGIISENQLSNALNTQKSIKDRRVILGQVLVETGVVSQEKLDQAVMQLIQDQNQAVVTKRSDERPRKTNSSEMTVRTSVEHLNVLMNLVGELITDRNHLYQIRSRVENEVSKNGYADELSETVAHIGRITDQLQEEVLRIRMLPIGNVFGKFPRMIRDLAHRTNKKVELIIHGEETELDRSVIEEINDPIIHMLRNSIDHGIERPEERIAAHKSEQGTITLSARHEQGRINITVADDGRGIDVVKLRQGAVNKGLITKEEADNMTDDESINLIFYSGLSTATNVSDISGRGVGMDIVRNNIQKINGTISVETTPGQGTEFQIVLPLTLAIIPTMLVEVNQITFAFPLVMVAETLRVTRENIKTIRGKPVILLRDSVLPLVGLADAFDCQTTEYNSIYDYVVVIYYGKLRLGVIVDRLLGEEEVVVKSLGSFIGDVPGISSAAILGDGKVALIVDVPGLLKLSGIR